MYEEWCAPLRVPGLVSTEAGLDAGRLDGVVNNVLYRPWVLEDEEVLLGLLAERIIVNFVRSEHHGIFFVVHLPAGSRLD